MSELQLFDTVTNLNPIPRERLSLVEDEYPSMDYLPKGQVGTIVQIYDHIEEPQYLIEFADTNGCEYAMTTLKKEEILVLHYELSLV